MQAARAEECAEVIIAKLVSQVPHYARSRRVVKENSSSLTKGCDWGAGNQLGEGVVGGESFG